MDGSSAPISRRIRDMLEVVNTPFRHAQDALRFPRSERRWWSRIERSFALRPEPLLVYSAPKTASTSLADAVERLNTHTVIKVHHVQPEFFWPGVASTLVTGSGGMRHKAIHQRPTRAWLARFTGTVRTVSLVRDPVAFNVSNFTYFGRGFWMRTCWRSAPWMSPDDLYARFERTFPHGSSDVWWSREFAPTTGIDALAEPFDAERGWQVLRRGRFECLVLRTDVPDAEKGRALQEFLGWHEPVALDRLNPNAEQAPPVLRERLREAILARPGYVDRVLALSSVAHFWTPAQREAMRARWTGARGA